MAYLADPGGRFASDTHRRVLANLSPPHEPYGWVVPALLERMRPDVGTNIQTQEELQAVLSELEEDGHAHKVSISGQDVWTMTQEGFDVLTGSIANEPPEGAAVVGPAVIRAPGAAAATMLEEGNGAPISPEAKEAAEQPSPDQEGHLQEDEEVPPPPPPQGGQQ